MNHYASTMFADKAGRHYWFAKNLTKQGFDTTVFAASTFFDTTIEDTGKQKYIIRNEDDIDFVFVKTRASRGNGIKRIQSWMDFYKHLFSVTKSYEKEKGKPDVIIASSVHPLTMIAGIKIARKMKVPCICEIRDLWPEAIFQFGKSKEKSIVGKILVRGEHWIYKNADALIFTKEGDTDYLKEKGWTTEQGGDINLSKCHYINNGVDIAAFDERKKNERLEDVDLLDISRFNVIYAGTIRPVNNVGNLLDAALIIKNTPGYEDVSFLIYGGGEQLEDLRQRTKNENISNVKLKGVVERRYIPFILSHSQINMLNYAKKEYNWTRGNSSNKLFEYMASGQPIISTVQMGYSIIKKYNCGIELEDDTPQELAKQIMYYHDMSKEERIQIGNNARIGAKDFDFVFLTEKLINVINSVT